MAGLNVGPFGRRLKALIYKNFLVSVVRRPIGFFFCVYGIPILILAILASIPDFVSSSNKHGISSPAPIQKLSDVIDKKLVVVRPDYLHEEVDRVIETVVEGIPEELIQYETEDGQLANICLANLRGVSPCFAGLSFFDSPQTTADIPPEYQAVGTGYGESVDTYNHTWMFTMRFDPARSSGRFDATAHDNLAEKFQLPLHLAVNNAITNSSTTPDIFTWTHTTQEEKERADQESAVSMIAGTYIFALFACYLFIIYRHVSLITGERESGMARLIDSMGGGHATIPRVLSWLLTFNMTCLPVWIIFGIIDWAILFPSCGAGLLIGAQILLGLAVNSSTVFAASFFAKSRVSAIYVMGGFLLLAVGAQVFVQSGENDPTPPPAYALSLLFPSFNFVLFTIQMCYWEMNGMRPDLSRQPPLNEYPGANLGMYKITAGECLGFLVFQIFFYPVLAIVVEKFMHGIDFKSRTFAPADNHPGGAVAETFELKKYFTPTILEKIFCCGRRKEVKAVNGVSIQGHKGQILCLVGPNGSGKTTTLHMMSGFMKPTSGTVNLGIYPSEIGICPQRNTLWDDLTVEEHVSIWSGIKAASESKSELDQLIESCDLDSKRTSRGSHLSGGQKRKLQLACMFVGGSSVCLIDECTSGLDPLSRRVIWDILLEQRAKRSIVFTTHFLDEVDVLADKIVILTKGIINCQGPSAELKTIYGGGYRVSVPAHTSAGVNIQYPSTLHQDRLVYTTPDSRTAAEVASAFNAAGVKDIGFNGPQVEDVFLRVADEGDLSTDLHKYNASTTPLEFEFEHARITSFGSQVWTMFCKRLTVLKRFWFPYFWVVALPLIITPFLKELTFKYKRPTCADLAPQLWAGYPPFLYHSEYCMTSGSESGCDKFAISPPSANETMYDILMDGYNDLSQVDNRTYYEFAKVRDNHQDMYDYVEANKPLISGAVGLGEDGEAPLLGFLIWDFGATELGYAAVNLWTEMTHEVEIVALSGSFADSVESPNIAGTIYAVFFTLIQAIWPAACVLYPAIEKSRKVRAIEYANGVRRGPLWIAYGLFDMIFVFIIAIATAAIINAQLYWWNGPPFIMFPILLLYGIAAVLLGYVISHFVNGPLKSFLATAGISLLMYIIAAIAFAVSCWPCSVFVDDANPHKVGSGFSGAESVETVTNGITFGLNLILPIGNVFRAVLLGANVSKVGCRNGDYTAPHSIYAYGGPILYLCIQVAVLLTVIIWIEGDLALFRRKGSKAVAKASERDVEMKQNPSMTSSAEVIAEKHRVEHSEDDLLRIMSLYKSFGSNHAVQNVTLGLPQNDVMALLGPNGAGKSTLVNMIQSELSPDHGRILLQGEDSRTRSAQRYLGVCPQFDALDLMSTREHLEFYAKVKGIRDVKGNVEQVMNRLALTAHAKTNASKLSGGNKRKLSLAIALMGAPPVMVLDEPTSAMDAIAKRSFWKLVQEITPGRSVLLTTHSMEEADTLATRAAIISGRLLAVGTTEALREKYSNVYYVTVLLASAPNSDHEEMASLQSWVSDNFPGSQLERKMLGGQIRFTIPGTNAQGVNPVAEVIDLLEREKDRLGVQYYNIEGATLERVFLSVARENNAQEEDGTPRRGFLSRVFRR